MDWLGRELSQYPAGCDRHLVTGLSGERYLFDTRSCLVVQLYGPAVLLIEAVLAAPERDVEQAREVVARFSAEDVQQAMADYYRQFVWLGIVSTVSDSPSRAI
jgi:hypothetical protein